MTDKQIIIDGVDVKDCKRRIGKDNFCRYYKRPCTENNYNCIWKKYLRKEQECERLKEENTEIRKYQYEQDFLQQQLDQLKAENEELKEILNEGCLHNLTLMTEQRVLLQTLTEIKELIQSDYCTEIGSCEFCAEIGNCLNRKILQKISEVEDE